MFVPDVLSSSSSTSPSPFLLEVLGLAEPWQLGRSEPLLWSSWHLRGPIIAITIPRKQICDLRQRAMAQFSSCCPIALRFRFEENAKVFDCLRIVRPLQTTQSCSVSLCIVLPGNDDDGPLCVVKTYHKQRLDAYELNQVGLWAARCPNLAPCCSAVLLSLCCCVINHAKAKRLLAAACTTSIVSAIGSGVSSSSSSSRQWKLLWPDQTRGSTNRQHTNILQHRQHTKHTACR